MRKEKRIMAVFVAADLHFNHPGILRFERPQFKTVEEHNQTIVDNWNATVGDDDVAYILGDVGFTPLDALKPWTRALKGHKTLILGNHDKITQRTGRDLGFEKVIVGPIYFNDKIILCHEPAMEGLNNPYVIVIHGHIHNGKLDLPNYYNVNIARTGYKPVSIEPYKLTAEAKCKSRRESFMREWYKDHYAFDEKKGDPTP